MKHIVQRVQSVLPMPKLVCVPVCEIVPAPYLVRACAPEETAALAESIRLFGLLQPPGVRRIRSRRGSFELLFGYQRLLACRLLHLPRIPCLLFHPQRTEDAAAFSQAENGRCDRTAAKNAPRRGEICLFEEEDTPVKPRRGVVRDARLIANSIDRAVQAGQSAGFPVEVQKIERAEEICYRIRLPRKSGAPKDFSPLFTGEFPGAG